MTLCLYFFFSKTLWCSIPTYVVGIKILFSWHFVAMCDTFLRTSFSSFFLGLLKQRITLNCFWYSLCDEMCIRYIKNNTDGNNNNRERFLKSLHFSRKQLYVNGLRTGDLIFFSKVLLYNIINKTTPFSDALWQKLKRQYSCQEVSHEIVEMQLWQMMQLKGNIIGLLIPISSKKDIIQNKNLLDSIFYNKIFTCFRNLIPAS